MAALHQPAQINPPDPPPRATGLGAAPGAQQPPPRAAPRAQPQGTPTPRQPRRRGTSPPAQPTGPTLAGAVPSAPGEAGTGPASAEGVARPFSAEATGGAGPARPSPAGRQAQVLEQALVPAAMASALGLADRLVGAAGYRQYLAHLRKEAGDPTDPVEVSRGRPKGQ